MKIPALAATAVLASVMVLGGAFAASAAPTDDPSATSGSGKCSFRQHLAYAWQNLPDNLQSDLKTLKSEPKGDRAAEAKQIRQNSLAGDYGAEIQKGAQGASVGGGDLIHRIQVSSYWQDCTPATPGS